MEFVKVDALDKLRSTEQVAADLRRAIADGEARPGERLPLAKDLATVLDVNTNTVLRALRMLCDEGLLEFRRGRGITVAGTPERGAVMTKVNELVKFAREQGYKRDELITMIEGRDLEGKRQRSEGRPHAAHRVASGRFLKWDMASPGVTNDPEMSRRATTEAPDREPQGHHRGDGHERRAERVLNAKPAKSTRQFTTDRMISMTCMKCGRAVPAEAGFCGTCGAFLTGTEHGRRGDGKQGGRLGESWARGTRSWAGSTACCSAAAGARRDSWRPWLEIQGSGSRSKSERRYWRRAQSPCA